jgi:hypothetical protein
MFFKGPGWSKLSSGKRPLDQASDLGGMLRASGLNIVNYDSTNGIYYYRLFTSRNEKILKGWVHLLR